MYPHKWDICFLLLGAVVEKAAGDTAGAEEALYDVVLVPVALRSRPQRS
jgi:hypothetical protein